MNNIARYLGKVDFISVRIQYNQQNNIIQCENIFTSQISTNYNNIQQVSGLQAKPEQSTSPTKQYSSVCRT